METEIKIVRYRKELLLSHGNGTPPTRAPQDPAAL